MTDFGHDFVGLTKFGQPFLRNTLTFKNVQKCRTENNTENKSAKRNYKGEMPAFRVSTGLHVEHRQPKAGDAPHEGLLKVERREFRQRVKVLGFRV